MPSKTKATVKPATELKRLLPTITHEELLTFIAQALEEGARRADNYADLTCKKDVPRDALNEAFAYVIRIDDLFPSYTQDARLRDAWRLVRSAREDLQEALNA